MRTPLLLAALALCAACSSSDDKKPEAESPTPSPGDVDDGCARGSMESDLAFTPMSGPKVSEGALMAPGNDGYVTATTFLRLRPGEEAAARFQELAGPIIASFASRPGMQAFQLGLSASCNTARTLSVWATTEDMFDFVTSDEHMNAMNAVSEVSRGGSMTVHWEAATTEESSWDEAAKRLAAGNGPFY